MNQGKWGKRAVSLSIMAILAGFLIVPNFIQNISIKDIFLAQSSQEEKLNLPKSNKREPDQKINVVLTAYTSTTDQCDGNAFVAASGKRVYDGMLATNGLPLGTKIKIPSLYGDKIFTVDDRMNKKYGFGRMDIWLDASQIEARKFGVKRATVEIYYNE